jgi:RES domain-containing protein
LGTGWIKDKTPPALRVPSVVIPRESNFMLNPEYPHLNSIAVDAPLPLTLISGLSLDYSGD